MLTKYSILYILILFPLMCFSQLSEYRFNNIGLRNSLTNLRVTSIIQDEQGFLWFGTAYGLGKYDGNTIKSFLHKTNDTSSINDNYIDKIQLGPSNTLWIYTSKGWNIYDPKKESFITHTLPILKKMGLPHEWFKSIIKGNADNYWFVYASSGLYKFNSKAGSVVRFSVNEANHKLYSDNVTAIAYDKNGHYWIVYSEGILEARSAKNNQVLLRKKFFNSDGKNINFQIFIDQSNEVWVYAPTEKIGVWLYKPSTSQLIKMDESTQRYKLNNEIVNGITQDEQGLIWLATDHGGINLVDKKLETVRYLTYPSKGEGSVSENAIQTIFKDRYGTIWLGTFKNGINYYDRRKSSFQHYYHVNDQSNSLPFNDVNCFAEDRLGNLWIGTNGQGLVYYDRNINHYKTYRANSRDVTCLSSDVITSLCFDTDGTLWIGTYFGGLCAFDGNRFIRYGNKGMAPSSSSEDNIWTIFEDSKKRMWIGTLTNGLALLDKENKCFISYSLPRPYKYSTNAIIEDRVGNLWAGGSAGIDVYNTQGKLVNQFSSREGDFNSISNTSVLSMHEDSEGNVWIGTRDGLNVYDPKQKKMYHYQVEDGLPHNTILRIIEDKLHRFWLSTPNGISCVSLVGPIGKVPPLVTNYNESDGLQGSVFNDAAALLTRKGEVIFGGSNGFNIYQQNENHYGKDASHIMFTNLQLLNQNVLVGHKYNDRVVLPESISFLKQITLTKEQDAFSVEFAYMDFIDADKYSYYYQLKGFNDEWIPLELDQKKITFTGLLPGSYTLSVRAKNETGAWMGDAATLSIKILPPWWISPLALFIYGFCLIGGLIYGRVLIIRKERSRLAKEHEGLQTKKRQELDAMKIHFFTNVSHEFKTPLVLIITFVEKVLKHCKSEMEGKQLMSINRHAKRLLNMVDELLDFGKLQKGESQLNEQEGDIHAFCNDVYHSFAEIAENKAITYTFKSNNQALWMTFDPDKLERILYNLLSNAFKFTSEGGFIEVELGDFIRGNELFVEIVVRDSGIGISEELKNHIFERFYQAPLPPHMINQGSGIGLSICKEFISVLGGTITVESELAKGSVFRIALPAVNGRCLLNVSRGINNEEVKFFPSQIISAETNAKKVLGYKDKKILIVEDNIEYRNFLKETLNSHFNVIEASNGREGWQKTLAEHPSLIVSDLNMPEMDGIEFCQKVKKDNRTSFIPFLLLTVVGSTLRHLEGLEIGANDYLTKPFISELLISKIRNLIIQQDKLKLTFQKQVSTVYSIEDVPADNSDALLIQKALTYVEEHISNASLSVQDLSRELLVGRATLYRKLFELTGKTPIEFIRDIRLQRAKRMLETNDKITISEIAYEVGFNDPKYFTKVFKEVYRLTPSAYQETYFKKLINNN